MDSYDSGNISAETKDMFESNTRYYARKRRVIGLIGVLIGLTCTYGLLIYFVFETVIRALSRA
jgi:hypothetical protein